MIRSALEGIRKLRDKVVLAHACTNGIWVYYGIIAFCLFYLVARWPA